MAQTRQRLSMEHRWNSISVLDNIEETVLRAYKAYQLISPDTIKRGWYDACPPLKPIDD